MDLAEINRRRALSELLAEVKARCPQSGVVELPVPGLRCSRRENAGEDVACFYETCIALIVQGSKKVTVGRQELSYGAGDMILVTVDMPSCYRIEPMVDGSPFYALSLRLDRSLLFELCSKVHAAPVTAWRAFEVHRAGADIVSCLLRLMQCSDPEKVDLLAPLIKQELYYHLLKSSFGPQLRQIFGQESRSAQIIKAVDYLKRNFKEPISIEALASLVNMASPTFYRHFKQFLSISPLQYQKSLRLHEARRLMLTENYTASQAAYAVGYESDQQFSREYKRLFGLAPRESVLNERAKGALQFNP